MTLLTWPHKQWEHYHPENNDRGNNENNFTIKIHLLRARWSRFLLNTVKTGWDLLLKSLLILSKIIFKVSKGKTGEEK